MEFDFLSLIKIPSFTTWPLKIPSSVFSKKKKAIMAGSFLKREKDEVAHVRLHRARRCIWFWDYRPFTRIVERFRAYLNLRDYILINKMEGLGVPRAEARWFLRGPPEIG